jgi:hypothetical protein
MLGTGAKEIQVCEASHSPTSNTKTKNGRKVTSTLVYALILSLFELQVISDLLITISSKVLNIVTY